MQDRVYHLEDLDHWDFHGTPLAVLGFPVAHSLSPPMHNAALQALASTRLPLRDWRYLRFEVPAERLPQALPRLHAAGFRGLNLTIPHKVQAAELLTEVAPLARAMGAVNTLIAGPTGWRGDNTDGYGLTQAVRETLGCDLKGTPVLLLGAGGAARAIAVQCLQSGCRHLWILNRSRERLAELLALLKGFDGGPRLTGLTPEALESLELPPNLLVINATSLGLKADDPSPVEVTLLPAGSRIYDTTYGVRNALARETEAAGLPYADGLSMLVWQGARALELWAGLPPPVALMREAAEQSLARRAQAPH